MTIAMYRQGDVLLIHESTQRCLFRAEDTGAASVVLAHGEKTGHTHSVPASDAMLDTLVANDIAVNRLYVHHRTRLMHQEHAPIPLAPGIYRVVIQRQYDPAADRPVGD